MNQSDVAEDLLRQKLLCFCGDDPADSLRSSLHDPAGPLSSLHHGDSIGGRMRHGLFAVHVLAGAHRVHNDLLVPVVRDGDDQAINVLAAEEIVITAGCYDLWSCDFSRESVARVIQVACGNTFDTRQLDRISEQARALHADTYDTEPHTVAWRDLAHRRVRPGWAFWLQRDGLRDGVSSGGSSAVFHEVATRDAWGSHAFEGQIMLRRLDDVAGYYARQSAFR